MKKVLILIVLPIILCALVYASAYTVNERESVVVTQFGRWVRTEDEAGLYFKLPGGIQKVNRFDRRLNVFETQELQLLLKGKDPIIVSCYVAWKIEDPLKFFQSLGSVDDPMANATRKLTDMVNSDLGGVLGECGIESIISVKGARPDLKKAAGKEDAAETKDARRASEKRDLSRIEDVVLAGSNARAMERYGIAIVQLGVRRLAYPNVVSDAVYQRMAAEREKEAEKLRAEGREAANKIETEADTEAKRILAAAYRDGEIKKGEGDKKAMETYRKAYSQDTEFFDFLRSLETYQAILDAKSTLILSTRSELFKYLSPEAKEKEKAK